MRSLFRFGCIWVLLSSCFAQQSSIPKPVPTAQQTPDRDAFTITRYDLQINMEADQHTFNARGKITMRNDAATPQSRAALQISSSLKWASIKLNGQLLSFSPSRLDSDIDHTGAVNEAVLQFPSTIAPGGRAELEIGYQGTIVNDATRLQRLDMPVDLARKNDWDRITPEFTAIRGVGYVTWYPVAIAPAKLSDGNIVFERIGKWKAQQEESSMKLRVNVTSGAGTNLTLISNGHISDVSTTTSGNISLLSGTVDIPRLGIESSFIVLAPYQTLGFGNGEFFYFEKAADLAQRQANVFSKMQPFVANQKPFARVIQLPDGFAAFESGVNLLTPFRDVSENELQQQFIHVLTHGAFYSARPWIYQGLAHFAQARLIEQQFGRKTAIEFLEQRRGALALAEPENPDEKAQSLINASNEIFYRTKAMYVWWMLNDMLGEAVLQKALARYVPAMDKEPSYIQRLLESESKKDLEWFFDGWVYRDRGLPDFRITAVYPRQNIKGSYLVTVTVENTGDVGAEVPVRVRTKEAESVIRIVVPAKDKAAARIDVPLYPVAAIVNDGSVPESDPNNNSFEVPPPK